MGSLERRPAMAALTAAVVVNYSIFLVFPTVIARPPVPVGDTTAEILYRWLIGIDSPANCFPSGHITAPAVGCWCVSRERQRGRGSSPPPTPRSSIRY